MWLVLYVHVFALIDIIMAMHRSFIHLFLALGMVSLLRQHQFVIARLVINILGYIAILTWLIYFLIPLPFPQVFASIQFGDFEDGPALSFELFRSRHGIVDSWVRLRGGVGGWR